MDGSTEFFREHYSKMDEDKLLELYDDYKKGNLTENASAAMKYELSKRGLTNEKIQMIYEEIKLESEQELRETPIPGAPKILVGFVLIGTFLIAEIIELIFEVNFNNLFLSPGEEVGIGPLSTAIALAGLSQIYQFLILSIDC